MERAVNHSKHVGVRMPPSLVQWLERYGKPLGTQVREDLWLLRAILEIAHGPGGDQYTIAEALAMARRLREW